MKNVEPQKESQTESAGWTHLPLFAGNVEPQTDTNDAESSPASPSDKEQSEHGNVEPHTMTRGNTPAIILPDIETNYSAKTVLLKEPEQRNNSDIGTDKIRDAGETVSANFARRRNLVKKPNSQKRSVVTNKFFTSPEEKKYLQEKAKESSESFSNYVRFHLGLPPNSVGRKKHNITAAFDLDFDE